ncbi:uncharacterized protein PFL1_02621 [Pseudozyma flocculosa PF-1]|uniref:Related to Extracellular metalloprotease MGYG_07913 n=2 Tax=Pseudozyma flocculosa TaxID=84751 RepID=A0A5C3F1V0_9BASI|nr:uncharacterized protein PFL1_02621 [Pseudozyma flocculosa PF-1]EPQ29949.1 hypothetical protein PFL1_02621 [Pseudozyma flocculosa PF-1]SPO37261.1 related to Extracellular metalloprotease MGYG_07913 [Pseudozyma flocculosa]
MRLRLAILLPALVAFVACVPRPALSFSCGAPSQSPEEAAEVQSAISSLSVDATAKAAPVSIPIAWHVITDNQGHGDLTATQIQAWIDVLNKEYSKIGFSFRLSSTDRVANSDWFYVKSLADVTFKPMYDRLYRGDRRTLNVYTLNLREVPFLGWSTYPWGYPKDPKGDGILIQHDFYPGSPDPRNNLGRVLIHEVGHWLGGLLHVFQGYSCTGPGDQVWDTPQQKVASKGCPARQDSCPAEPGLDNIHNYMDYVDDICMEEFTPGQITRMKQVWAAFRA